MNARVSACFISFVCHTAAVADSSRHNRLLQHVQTMIAHNNDAKVSCNINETDVWKLYLKSVDVLLNTEQWTCKHKTATAFCVGVTAQLDHAEQVNDVMVAKQLDVIDKSFMLLTVAIIVVCLTTGIILTKCNKRWQFVGKLKQFVFRCYVYHKPEGDLYDVY